MGGGINQGDNSAHGMLTVTARVSNGASRYAMPSPNISDFVYAALLYKDGERPENPPSEDFVEGVQNENGDKLIFSFQRPDETDGFTLEVFAFKNGTTNFSKDNALLSGKKPGLKVNGDAIEVVETIVLSVYTSSTEKGTVSLQIKVPDGCTLTIDDITNFAVTGASPNFTITQNGDSIPAGKYSVTFTVKKVDETDNTKEEIIHIFPESINVLPGMCTDTWSGLAKGAAKVITQDMFSSTVYVRGAGGWYETSDYKDTAVASDSNSGTFLSPLATIQKAVDTIIARNDGTSDYTICVDGTLDGTTAAAYLGANGMADFSALTENLNLTIKALSGTATLDGGARFDADGNVKNGKNGIGNRIIYAKPKSGVLNLTLEKLVITGAYNISGLAGGIYFNSPGGKLTISGGTKINGNRAYSGGGVYVSQSTFTMEDGIISNCTVRMNGGGVCIESSAIFNMSETAKITGCKTTSTEAYSGGGGICNSGTLTITGGTISDCTSASYGGGVYIYNGGNFTMSGGTIGGENEEDGNIAGNGGGVYVGGSGIFKMEGDTSTISKNKANYYGGGVFVATNSRFEMGGGTISGNEAPSGGGVYIGVTSSAVGTFIMSGSASVPAEEDGKNNVYLYGNVSNFATITVAGELSDSTPVPVATITPSVYEENRPLLSAGDGMTLSGTICNKFAVMPQSDGTEWRVALDGTDGVLIKKYEMGETGPGGGDVYYYSADGFTVNGKTCHYLEYSKETIGNSTWCPCTSTSGYCAVTHSNDIGAGYANTQTILDHPNHASATASNCAARACAEYSTSTTSAGEWFLPSLEEANKIYRGGTITSSEPLWYSASNYSNATSIAGYITVSPGGCGTGGQTKTTVLSVRAVRAF